MSPTENQITWNRRFTMMLQHTSLLVIAAVLLCAASAASSITSRRCRSSSASRSGRPAAKTPAWCRRSAAQLRERGNIRLQITVMPGGAREAATTIDNKRPTSR